MTMSKLLNIGTAALVVSNLLTDMSGFGTMGLVGAVQMIPGKNADGDAAAQEKEQFEEEKKELEGKIGDLNQRMQEAEDGDDHGTSIEFVLVCLRLDV